MKPHKGEEFLASTALAVCLEFIVVSVLTLAILTLLLPTSHSASVADICAVVDASGSISTTDYSYVEDYLMNMVKGLDMSPTGDNFAIVVFSSRAQKVLGLSGDKATVLSTLEKLPFPRSATNTHKGLAVMRTILNGGRKGVEKIALLVTDGRVAYQKLAEVEAQAAKNDGVYILCIRIGNNVNDKQLDKICSDPTSDFKVASFLALQSKTSDIVQVDSFADVVVGIDGSGSISTSDFDQIKATLTSLADSLPVTPTGDHMGIVLFASVAKKVIALTGNNADVKSAIQGMKQPFGSTNTHNGLDLMRRILTLSAEGARSDAEKIAILLSDFFSSNKPLAELQAKLMKSAGIYIICVAVGSIVDQDHLNKVCSDPTAIRVASFSALLSAVPAIATKVASVAPPG